MIKNLKYMFLFFMVGGCVNNVHKSQIPLENGCVMNLYFANNIAESVDYAFSCGNTFEAFEIIDKNKNNENGVFNAELGQILFHYGYTDQAVVYFNKAIKLNEAQGYYGLASIYNLSGSYKDIGRVIELLNRSIDLGYDDAYYNLGMVYLDEEEFKDIEKAENYLNESLRTGNPRAFYGLGEVSIENKDFNNAEMYFKKAVEYQVFLEGYQGLMFLYGFYPEYLGHDLDKSFYYMNKTLELTDDEFVYQSASEFYELEGKYKDSKKSAYYAKLAKEKAVN
ncbi:tetratricopeptide repeat protein [Acinetobacter rudis]|uniref:tetratricopeptide repeat protein n=1 Tax=Acinetobacter rudis TaxID=632955 RepID=UPI00333F9E9A